VFIPNLKDILNDLDRKLREYNQIVDKEALDIEKDVSQLF
jgi:hypothetical protein